jgi:hypothetical protein
VHIQFWSEILNRRDNFEDLGIDGKIILEWVLEKQGGKRWGVDWIHLAQDRDHWWAVVNAIMKHGVP